VELEGWRLRKDRIPFLGECSADRDSRQRGRVTGYTKVTREFYRSQRAEEAVTMQLTGALLANQDVSKLLGAFSAGNCGVDSHTTQATLALPDSTDDRVFSASSS